MDALVRNAADAEQVERAGRKVESREDRAINDLRYVMLEPSGRRFLWGISGAILFGEQGPYQADSDRSAYNLGIQSVARGLVRAAMEADPELYARMVKEAKDDE